MTERLDRIERILERIGERLDSTGEQLDRTAAQQRQNTIDIDNLLGAITVSETRIQQLTAHAEETETRLQQLTAHAGETDQRFATLQADGIADRLETRRLFNDAVNQMNIDRARIDSDNQA